MVIESLDKSNKVLLVYIDGLSYELYEKAVKTGNIPYMASLNKGIKALTVYPPITDVAFASMVTGKTPKYTGIHNREKKPLSVDTIFDIANQQGKKSKVIEGNIRILTSQVETILNIDLNNNGTIDDEIYDSAMKELQAPPDFLIVHFHSYDDIAHVYGPNSKEAQAQLQLLDSYIEDMLNTFTGDVIITSDHGMHDEGDGGNHGMFISLDMLIPIILQRCEAGDL
jgi:predicted AlkP superfamily pyrophosphatase or phosphodiesterase